MMAWQAATMAWGADDDTITTMAEERVWPTPVFLLENLQDVAPAAAAQGYTESDTLRRLTAAAFSI